MSELETAREYEELCALAVLGGFSHETAPPVIGIMVRNALFSRVEKEIAGRLASLSNKQLVELIQLAAKREQEESRISN